MSNDENYTPPPYKVEARPHVKGKWTGAITNADTGVVSFGCGHRHDTKKAATDCVRNLATVNNWHYRIIN